MSVKYSLALEEKDCFTNIDLGNVLNNNINQNNLESIVDFTSNFNSVNELKLYLYNSGLIKATDISKKLAIKYKINGCIKKLKYGDNGITLKSDKKFFEYDYIFYYLLSKFNDLVFLQKLCFNLKNIYNQTLIGELYVYMNNIKNGNCEQDNYMLFEEAISNLIHSQIPLKKGKDFKKYICQYKKLRDFAMLISSIDKEINKENSLNSPLTNEEDQLLIEDFIFDDVDILKRYHTYADEEGYPGDLENLNPNDNIDEEEIEISIPDKVFTPKRYNTYADEEEYPGDLENLNPNDNNLYKKRI